jgi:hypothetical protein
MLNINLLAYGVANDFANTIFNDFVFGGGSFFTAVGRPRLYLGAEHAAIDIAEKQGHERQGVDKMPVDVWRKAVAQLPEDERNSQIIENAPLDRFQQFGQLQKKYQLGAQGLAAGAAIVGFSLYNDIQAMRVKKAKLTTKLEKINNMLVALKKVK